MVIKSIRNSDYFHKKIRNFNSKTTDTYLNLVKKIEEQLKNTKVDIVIKNKGGVYMTVKTPRILDKKSRKLVTEEIKSFLSFEKKQHDSIGEQIILRNLIDTFEQVMEDKKQIKENEVLISTTQFDLADEKYLNDYAKNIGKPVKLHQSKFSVLFEKEKMPKVFEK